MEKTGNTTIEVGALDSILWTMGMREKRALDYKKAGQMEDYYNELEYFLGCKNTLERLGLIVKEDYDFNKEA